MFWVKLKNTDSIRVPIQLPNIVDTITILIKTIYNDFMYNINKCDFTYDRLNLEQ
jgi:hypothetical protein